jgi:hypothetical protein
VTSTNPADRDLDEWDAEIEAEFQRVVAGANQTGRKWRRKRFIGCPPEFFVRLARIDTRSSSVIVVGMCLYRRHYIVNQTVTGPPKAVGLPKADLMELGISRGQTTRALEKLAAAALIEMHPSRPGRKTLVTVLWPVK